MSVNTLEVFMKMNSSVNQITGVFFHLYFEIIFTRSGITNKDVVGLDYCQEQTLKNFLSSNI